MPRESIKEIAARLSKPLSEVESQDVMKFIEQSTYIVKGTLAVPGEDDPHFHRLGMAGEGDVKELMNSVINVLCRNQHTPQDVYILTNARKDFPGLVKVDFSSFARDVLPSIVDDPTLANYWITDMKRSTVTFHHEGDIYWKDLTDQH